MRSYGNVLLQPHRVVLLVVVVVNLLALIRNKHNLMEALPE